MSSNLKTGSANRGSVRGKTVGGLRLKTGRPDLRSTEGKTYALATQLMSKGIEANLALRRAEAMVWLSKQPGGPYMVDRSIPGNAEKLKLALEGELDEATEADDVNRAANDTYVLQQRASREGITPSEFTNLMQAVADAPPGSHERSQAATRAEQLTGQSPAAIAGWLADQRSAAVAESQLAALSSLALELTPQQPGIGPALPGQRQLALQTNAALGDLKTSNQAGFADLKATNQAGFNQLDATNQAGFNQLDATNQAGFNDLGTTTEQGFNDLSAQLAPPATASAIQAQPATPKKKDDIVAHVLNRKGIPLSDPFAGLLLKSRVNQANIDQVVADAEASGKLHDLVLAAIEIRKRWNDAKSGIKTSTVDDFIEKGDAALMGAPVPASSASSAYTSISTPASSAYTSISTPASSAYTSFSTPASSAHTLLSTPAPASPQLHAPLLAASASSGKAPRKSKKQGGAGLRRPTAEEAHAAYIRSIVRAVDDGDYEVGQGMIDDADGIILPSHLAMAQQYLDSTNYRDSSH